MSRLVRAYLVRTFPRKGLLIYFVQNEPFFLFQKDIPNEKNALNRTGNFYMSKIGHKDQSLSISF